MSGEFRNKKRFLWRERRGYSCGRLVWAFFFLPGLYFSFFQQSGSGWLYSTTEQYPCTLFNLGVLNWELSLQLFHSLRPTCATSSPAAVARTFLLLRTLSFWCDWIPCRLLLQACDWKVATESESCQGQRNVPRALTLLVIEHHINQMLSLPLLLRQTTKRVTAWGKGTNHDKHETMSVVKVLAI